MRLEWINNKIITAAVVLSFSCVAAAAYTAVQEVETPADLSASEPGQYGFVYSLLDAEASLYDVDASQTQQAKLHLSKFQQQAATTLSAPQSHAEADLRRFALHADRLVQAAFPSRREVLSVTESLAQQAGSQTLNTWLLLSIARQFGVDASLSLQQDHAHVVLRTQDDSWVEWKVDHMQDMQEATLSALDDYDLWTAVDLTLVQHYVAARMQDNDDSIEALAKSAVLDAHGSQAIALYDEFLATRNRDLALLRH